MLLGQDLGTREAPAHCLLLLTLHDHNNLLLAREPQLQQERQDGTELKKLKSKEPCETEPTSTLTE